MFASRHAGTRASLTNQKVRWDRSGQSEDKGRYLLNNGTWTIRLSVANILMRGLTHFWSSECVRIMNEKTFLETFSFCRCFIRKTESEEIKEFLHPNKIRYLETKSSEVLVEKMLRHSRMGKIAQILKTFIHFNYIYFSSVKKCSGSMLSPPHQPQESFCWEETWIWFHKKLGYWRYFMSSDEDYWETENTQNIGTRWESRSRRRGRNLILRLNHSLHSTTYHITSITLD